MIFKWSRLCIIKCRQNKKTKGMRLMLLIYREVMQECRHSVLLSLYPPRTFHDDSSSFICSNDDYFLNSWDAAFRKFLVLLPEPSGIDDQLKLRRRRVGAMPRWIGRIASQVLRHRLHSPRRHGRDRHPARPKTPPHRRQPLRRGQGLRRRRHSRHRIRPHALRRHRGAPAPVPAFVPVVQVSLHGVLRHVGRALHAPPRFRGNAILRAQAGLLRRTSTGRVIRTRREWEGVWGRRKRWNAHRGDACTCCTS